MKTGFDAVDAVYLHLQKRGLPDLLTGGLRRLTREKNAASEDVVVNSLALNGAQMQKGVVNVNVHVPNLVVKLAGTVNVDNSQPNSLRLRELTKTVVDMLTDIYGYDYSFTIQTPGNPLKDDDGSWYANIRVVYSSVNF